MNVRMEDAKPAVAVMMKNLLMDMIIMDAIPQGKQKSKLQKELKLSAFLPLTRDFAFVMDKNVEAAKVIAAIQNTNRDLIKEISVFDVYEGEHLETGKKSIALQVLIQPMEKTLTDAEIETLCTQIVNFVGKATGATLRA